MAYNVTERLVLTPDNRLVPEKQATQGGRLFALPGDEISEEEAQRYGLPPAGESAPEPAAEPAPAPEPKLKPGLHINKLGAPRRRNKSGG